MKPDEVVNKLKHIFKINETFISFEDYLPIHIFYIDYKNPEFNGKYNWLLNRVILCSFLAVKRELKNRF